MAERVLMQPLSMLARARQPRGDRDLTGTEDPRGRRRIQPFCKRREDHGDLPGRGFQAIQGGVASSTERDMAGLAAKRLDPLGTDAKIRASPPG